MPRKRKSEDVVANWLKDTLPAAEAIARIRRQSTSTERVHKHRAKGYEIGAIAAIADPVERDACRLNLLRFGLTYCRQFLNHEPSAVMIQELIRPIEQSILHGGKDIIEFPRSTGKTTWIRIAAVWALAYGHRRFIVLIGATANAANDIFEQIYDALSGEDSPRFAADFPALAFPISQLFGNKKAAVNQTSSSHRTGMKFKASRFTLPSACNFDGELIDAPSAGSTLVACSMAGAIKGLVAKRERPDMVFLDDPQTEKVARSPSLTAQAEQFIIGSVLGLGGQTVEITALMAITPIRQGDLAARFADRSRHGDWRFNSVPYVRGWTAAMQSLVPAYASLVSEDVAIGDKTFALSRQFYLDHRDVFASAEVIDLQNFTGNEVDAVHHVLNMKVQYQDQFEPEFQMNVAAEETGFSLEATDVEKAVNDYPRFALPPGCTSAVAFCDVNVSRESGLRYGIMSFGGNRTAAIVHYGRYPAAGERLYPEGSDPETREAAIISGIKVVVGELMRAPLYAFETGERVQLSAIAFDGGYEMNTVDRTLKWIGQHINLRGTHLYWCRGYSWSRYNPDMPGVLNVKDHIHFGEWTSRDGKRRYRALSVQADYWREVAQRAYKIKYPATGSLSLFGADPQAQRHSVWAAECSYEKLIRVYREDGPRARRAWQWDNIKAGHNHSMDLTYNLLALGHWEGLYTALAKVDAPAPAASAPAPAVTPSPKPLAKAPPKKPAFVRKHRSSIFKKVHFR